jgi:antitoxin component YwqK of YwqJK toxin-antitoxin module
MAEKAITEEHIQYHKDGSIWARGSMRGGVPNGYWEWFRKDGTKLRSGHFINGEQTGEWTTYDKAGRIYKVTQMQPPAKKSAAGKRAGSSSPRKAAN